MKIKHNKTAMHFLAEGSSSPAAMAGYPAINVPMGNSFGLPAGITFTGTAFSEPTLIKFASGSEHVIQARIVPQFLPTLPTIRPRTTANQPPHRKFVQPPDASTDDLNFRRGVR